MKLIQALRISTPVCIAFSGAGGKTTAIFRAARELLGEKIDGNLVETVIVTTSTHFGRWQAKLATQVVQINSSDEIQKIMPGKLKSIIMVSGEETGDRLCGLAPGLLEELHRWTNERGFPLLIEADGAHSLALKAPAEYEPVIPGFTRQVVVVAGLSGLGKPLSENYVHRPAKFSELSGTKQGETITIQALVKVLLDMQGGVKNIPAQARRVVLLNQADTFSLQSQGRVIAEGLLPHYDACIIASLGRVNGAASETSQQLPNNENQIHAVVERTGGVVLAAGASSRFGEPKQLLKWKGEPLVKHVIRTALSAGLEPVVVVLGSSADEVAAVIKDQPVRIVNNKEWMRGISSSVRIGMANIDEKVGAVVFLQADQPQIPANLVQSLIETHQASLNPVVAPQIDGQRGNPVLFDAVTFKDLRSLDGDIGGRALFSRYPVEWLPWHDPKLLVDIDSMQDYQVFLQMYPESEVRE